MNFDLWIAPALFALAYSGIAVRATVDAFRRRARAWLAVSLVTFATVFVSLWLRDVDGAPAALVGVALVALAISGVSLTEYAVTITPVRARWRVAAAAAVGGPLAALWVTGGFQADDLAGAQMIAAGSLVLGWVLAVSVAAGRLWRATATSAAIQRGQLRLLSIAYASMGLLLVTRFALGVGDDPGRSAMLAWHVVGIGVAPVLVAALWPPSALRGRWLRRERERLAASSSRVVSWSVDRRTGHASYSPGTSQLFGSDAPFDDLPGLLRHVHPEDAALVDEQFGRTSRHGVATNGLEFRVVRPDGEIVWLRAEMRVTRDVDGAITGVFGVADDITAAKVAELQLAGRLADERRATDELRRVDAMKNTFLSAVSHELRTPLTVVQGIAMTMQHRWADMSVEQAQELLERLVTNAGRLNRLLGDLLDLDRLERDALELHVSDTDVSAMLAQVVEAVPTRGRSVSIVAPASLRASIDAAKIDRVVENLVINAVRHTPDDVPVWVRAEADDDRLTLVVEDAGPGVPDELKPVVFDQFQQGADSRSRGTGVGLALVARFVELHGGNVSVGDRPGGGASFRVEIPQRDDTPATHVPVDDA